MNTYQIAKITATGTEYITGALTYMEALQKVNEIKRTETSEDVSYSVELFMPNRVVSQQAAATAQKQASRFEVRVSDQDGKLQTVFGVERIALTAPGNMIAQYPALGKFLDSSHEQDGSHDEYRYSGGYVSVRKTL